MNSPSHFENNFHLVSNFHDLISTPYHENINAICWSRNLIGDFSEIVNKLEANENLVAVEPEGLLKLKLSEQGQLAREIILNDFELLKAHGASPVLNVIRNYDRDENVSFFPTDVYSFHVDRSPIPTNTFLCTYFGESSEILPNSQAQQKIHIPEIRNELRKLYDGAEEAFENFLIDNFFDLHYHALPDAISISLGRGHLWKLAVDHPGSLVLPCIHRAPKEKVGKKRLLMIC